MLSEIKSLESGLSYDKYKYLDDKHIEWLVKQAEKAQRYEETLKKIVEMESPFYCRETQLETPYNYAKAVLEKK